MIPTSAAELEARRWGQLTASDRAQLADPHYVREFERRAREVRSTPGLSPTQRENAYRLFLADAFVYGTVPAQVYLQRGDEVRREGGAQAYESYLAQGRLRGILPPLSGEHELQREAQRLYGDMPGVLNEAQDLIRRGASEADLHTLFTLGLPADRLGVGEQVLAQRKWGVLPLLKDVQEEVTPYDLRRIEETFGVSPEALSAEQTRALANLSPYDRRKLQDMSESIGFDVGRLSAADVERWVGLSPYDRRRLEDVARQQRYAQAAAAAALRRQAEALARELELAEARAVIAEFEERARAAHAARLTELNAWRRAQGLRPLRRLPTIANPVAPTPQDVPQTITPEPVRLTTAPPPALPAPAQASTGPAEVARLAEAPLELPIGLAPDPEEARALTSPRATETLLEALIDDPILREHLANSPRQVAAFGKGVARGLGDLAEGLVDMITDPVGTVEATVDMIENWDTERVVAAMGQALDEYERASRDDPEKFAEMTGYLVAQIEAALIGPKGGKSVADALRKTGRHDALAEAVETVVETTWMSRAAEAVPDPRPTQLLDAPERFDFYRGTSNPYEDGLVPVRSHTNDPVAVDGVSRPELAYSSVSSEARVAMDYAVNQILNGAEVAYYHRVRAAPGARVVDFRTQDGALSGYPKAAEAEFRLLDPGTVLETFEVRRSSSYNPELLGDPSNFVVTPVQR